MIVRLEYMKSSLSIILPFSLHMQLAEHGIYTNNREPCFQQTEREALPYKMLAPLIIVMSEPWEVEAANNIVNEYSKNKNLMLMWVGEDYHPKSPFVPLINWKKLKKDNFCHDWKSLKQFAME